MLGQRPAGDCPQACGAEKSVSAIRRGGLLGARVRPRRTSASFSPI